MITGTRKIVSQKINGISDLIKFLSCSIPYYILCDGDCMYRLILSLNVLPGGKKLRSKDVSPPF